MDFAKVNNTVLSKGMYNITVKVLQQAGKLIKGVKEIVQNEAKQQQGGLFIILLGVPVAGLLVNTLTDLL